MGGIQQWIISAILGVFSGVIANFSLVLIMTFATGEGYGASAAFRIGSIIGGIVGLVSGLLGGWIGERYNRGYLGAAIAIIGGALISILGLFFFAVFAF